MPFFGSSSPFDQDVERATSDTKTEEDWSLIIEICDKINGSTAGPKEAMRSLMKRLRHSSPRVVMHTLSLLGACVDNCGKAFQLELCSRDFYDFAFQTLRRSESLQPTLAARMKELIQDWVVVFEGDSRLGLIKKLYVDLKAEGVFFNEHNADKAIGPRSTPAPSSSSSSRSSAQPASSSAGSSYQDDIDLARAIELSLQEANATAASTPTSSLTGGDTSMYPSLYSSTSSSSPAQSRAAANHSSVRKVRALYDFDAAEDNELSFKAGELINILDDSDENWWRGETLAGTGLFPATFVTSDLSASAEPVHGSERKSVRFQDEVAAQPKIEISEEKINLLLEMLHSAAEDNEQEEATIKELEVECESMKPLIKVKIDAIDKERSDLMKLNEQFQNALRMYQQLMKEAYQPQQAPPTYAYPEGAGQTTMYEPTSTYQPGGYAHIDGSVYQVAGAPTNVPPVGGYIPAQQSIQAPPPQSLPPSSMASSQGMLPPGPQQGMAPLQHVPPPAQPVAIPPQGVAAAQQAPYYAPTGPVPQDIIHGSSPGKMNYNAPSSQPPAAYYPHEQPPPQGAPQGYDMPPPGQQPVYYYGQPGAAPMQQQPPMHPPPHLQQPPPQAHGMPTQTVEASLI